MQPLRFRQRPDEQVPALQPALVSGHRPHRRRPAGGHRRENRAGAGRRRRRRHGPSSSAGAVDSKAATGARSLLIRLLYLKAVLDINTRFFSTLIDLL